MLSTIFNFSTTDYSTVELASVAKRSQYSLQGKGSDFLMARRGHNLKVYKLLWYSSGRAVIKETILPNSNTRRDKLLRDFSEITLPKRTTLTSRAKNYAWVRRRKLSLNVRSTVRERKVEPCGVLLKQYSSTAVQFRLLGYSSGRAVTSNTILPNSNTRRDKLLCEFSRDNPP